MGRRGLRNRPPAEQKEGARREQEHGGAADGEPFPGSRRRGRGIPGDRTGLRWGRGGGLGPAVLGGMTGGRSTPVLWAAWPSTDIGTADGFAAVRNQHAYDDVIAPAETRQRISRLLARLPRQLDRVAKKHPIDTW